MSEIRGRKFKIIIAVLLLSGSFLFLGTAKKVAAATYLNSYAKPYNGTLTAQEWNNLITDFVNAKGGSAMDGPLGIGTGTPALGLEVNGPIKASNFSGGNLTGGVDQGNVLGGNGGSFGSNFGGGNYSFPGNLGVGTSSPQYKLDVNGIINATALYVNGSPYIGSQWINNGTSIYYNSGNVGIGTTGPGELLHVYNASANAKIKVGTGLSTAVASLVVSRASTSGYATLSINTGSSEKWSIGTRNDGTEKLYIQDEAAGVSRVVIDATTGNVGIGTTAPGQTLEIKKTSVGVAVSTMLRLTGETNAAYGGYTGIEGGYRDTGDGEYSPSVGSILFNVVRSGPGPNNHGGIISFNTKTLGSLYAASPTERMRIDNNGNVGINNTAPGVKLDVTGALRATSATISTVTSGIVMADSLGNFYATSSAVATGIPLPTGLAGQTLRSDGTNWLANSVLYNNGTNIGIGTTAPGAKLDVYGGSDNAVIQLDSLNINSSRVGGYTGSQIWANWNGAKIAAGWNYGLDMGRNGDFFKVLYMPTGSTSVAERFKIDSTGLTTIAQNLVVNGAGNSSFAGNVGIGTTAPGAKLDVRDGNLVLTNANMGQPFSAITANAFAQFQPLSGTAGGLSVWGISNADATGFNMVGYIGSNNPTNAVYKFEANKLSGTSPVALADADKAFQFYNRSTALVTILGSGNVGINTTGPGVKLDVSGALRATSMTDTTVTNGIVMADGSGNFYATSTSVATGIPAPTTNGQTLRANGTNWVANSILFNDGTNVGIGTTTMAAKLAVQGSGGDLLNLFDSTAVEKFTVLSNGNVGVGTTNPSVDLQVTGSLASTGSVVAEDMFALQRPTQSGVHTGWGVFSLGRYATGVSQARTRLDIKLNDGIIDDLSGLTTVMSLQANGNVGIGVTNPGAKLQVNGATILNNQAVYGVPADGGDVSIRTSGAYGTEGGLAITKSSNTDNTMPTLKFGHTYGGGASAYANFGNGQILFRGYDGTNYINGAYILSQNSGAFTTNVGYGDLRFGTNSASASASEKMRIMEGGNVGINTTAPGVKLDVNGGLRATSITDTTVTNGIVMADGSGNFYATSTSVATGIPNPATNGQTLRANGTSWVANSTLFNDGTNVGIGTTNPLAKLSVNGIGTSQVGLATVVDLYGIGADRARLTLGQMKTGAGTRSAAFDFYGYNAGSTALENKWEFGTDLSQNGTNDFYYYDALTAKTALYLSSTDNVGVNSTNPGVKLDINGGLRATSMTDTTVTNGIVMADGSGNFYATSTSVATGIPAPTTNGQTLRANGTSWVANSILFNDGTNVGIGVISPAQKLDVAGNIKLSSNKLLYDYAGSSPASGPSIQWTDGTYTNDIGLYISSGLVFQGNSGNPAFRVLTPTTNGTLGTEVVHLGGASTSDNSWFNGGNVGIGTITPGAYKLNVTGGDIYGSANALLAGTTGLTLSGAGADLNFTGTGPNQIFTASGVSLALMPGGTGNVGIGFTVPVTKLNVNGTMNSTAATISAIGAGYVYSDSAGNLFSTSSPAFSGDLNMAGHNIYAVNKLTVNTIDPLYTINGMNYSTFASSISGGVKEEYVGKVTLSARNANQEYEKIINFTTEPEGTDLWVWRQVIDFSAENVEVFMTPYGQFANTYYLIKGNELIFRSDKPVTLSYRLIGKRFDWQQWPTKALNQKEQGMIVR